jgi:FkbM family methyltransferase
MKTSPILENLFLALPEARAQHAPNTRLYALLQKVARREVEALFHQSGETAQSFPPFGDLVFPYFRMGAVDSLSLFDIDELILFSFYWRNRARYRRVLDIGANIGLHSIVLSKCGPEVRAFEPDPTHFALLQQNLARNGCARASANNAAVSRQEGVLEFVRVLGNTTGSHLAGAKTNPYGALERFPVQVESIHTHLGWADLIKMDVEGHEAEILLSTKPGDWRTTDALIEIGSASNAAAVYKHFKGTCVRLFSQKTNWDRVIRSDDMPTSYKDGSLFLTCRNEMPWGEGTDLASQAA